MLSLLLTLLRLKSYLIISPIRRASNGAAYVVALVMAGCNNPAPWVHPSNGTIYIVCGNEMKRAEHISGPWSVVTTFSHVGGPAGAYEDPYLYTDQHGWHLLYHVYTTGGLQLSQSHELLVPQSRTTLAHDCGTAVCWCCDRR